MQVMMNLVLLVQLLSALVMIGLVLVQHGKGADMGASLGSGASGSLFGATGSANFLSRSTAICATVFFVSTLGLGYMGHVRGSAGGGASVLDRAASSSAAGVSAPASAVLPAAAQIPGVVASPESAGSSSAK
jgi:preprotein translocase subunit SecG